MKKLAVLTLLLAGITFFAQAQIGVHSRQGSVEVCELDQAASLNVSISGVSSVPYRGFADWTAIATGGTRPYSYMWEIYYDDGTYEAPGEASEGLFMTVLKRSSFTVMVKVTDAAGNFDFASKYVTVTTGSGF